MSQSAFVKKIFEKNANSAFLLPDKEFAHQFLEDLFSFLFIPNTDRNDKLGDYEKKFTGLNSHLTTLIYDVTRDGEKAQAISDSFFDSLPGIYDKLLKDAAVITQFDPAAQSIEEVLVAYPGFYTAAVYRIANELWKQNVRMLPRLFTEYAHSKTGIDIHPGAAIGESFFIDHGTGIVIGETTVIGNNVKIYQGVTLGALNTPNKEKAIAARRHPIIQDNVIIYPGATILGGNAIIGKDSVIGANVWITHNVPPNSLVYHKSEVVARENFSFKTSVEDILKERVTAL